MIYHPDTPDNIRFAVGHEFYSLLPGLFMYATIWLREHNRVADVLKGEHPEWDEERLFQTTRLVTLGKLICFQVSIGFSRLSEVIHEYHCKILI